ncbi:hypothetical protein GC170_02335 [bacterium]|nr:hypothetical protein [bacterium]
MRSFSKSIAAIAAIVTTSLIGCGESEYRHSVFPASGKITRDGKPVANAIVVFHPTDPNTIRIPEGRQGIEIANPTTTTDESGAFRLSTYFEADGAPAGEYKVTVILSSQKFDQKKGTTTEGDEEKAPHSSTDALPADSPIVKKKFPFSNLESTPLQASIKPDATNEFAFELN